MGWRYVHDGVENDGLEIAELEVWKHKWRRTDEPLVYLPPPRYGLTFSTNAFRVYEIGDVGNPVRFATCEVAHGRWDFYVPDPDSATTAT